MKNIIAILFLVFTSKIETDLVFLKKVEKVKKVQYAQMSKIKNKIMENNPNIDRSTARHIASVVYTKTNKYGIPNDIFVAILAQESMYKLSAKNCNRKRCTDFGISQIHHSTVNRYKFDKNKLLTDLEYSVEAGCIVLKYFMDKYRNKEKNWYSRYNSSKPSLRKKYEKSVKRFL